MDLVAAERGAAVAAARATAAAQAAASVVGEKSRYEVEDRCFIVAADDEVNESVNEAGAGAELNQTRAERKAFQRVWTAKDPSFKAKTLGECRKTFGRRFQVG